MFKRLLLALLFALPAVAQIVPVDTAIVVTVGPLIDDTDFKSLETAIAYDAAGMSVDLIESSGTASTKTDLTLTTASTQDWTHLGNGIYEIEITAAQNNTEGNLQVVGVATGVLPFFSPVYTVVPTAVYNSLALGSDNLQVDTIQVEGADATDTINAQADLALTDYDAPTNTEMEARTLVAASYFDPAADTVANVTTVATLSGHTAQTADHAASIAAILADTAAQDTQAEIQTLIMGAAVAPASTTQAATAQADLDILTGTDGVTLATLQPNYAPNTTTPPTVGQIRTEMETAGGSLALVLEDTGTTIPAAITALNDPTAAAIADAVWLEALADHSGTAGSTAEALDSAGGGGGGDATAANQSTIITHLTDIKGATWSSSTDTLEAIANAVAAIDVGGGSGDTLIDHDTGGTDALRVVDGSGNGIENVVIRAYVTSEFTASPTTAEIRATATTAADGRWEDPYMMLDSGTQYTLYFHKPGVFGPATTTVTP